MEDFVFEGDFAGDEVEPGFCEVVLRRELFVRGEVAEVDLAIGAGRDGVIAAIRGGDQSERASGGVGEEVVIVVAGFASGHVGLKPDLEEVNGVGGGGIEFGMLDPVASGHVLEFARFNDAAVAHGILVFQLAGNDVGKDFHGAMRVGAEALAGSDLVIVDHAEGAKAAVVGVVVSGEGKGVVGIKPAVVGMEAVLGPANLELGFCHVGTLARCDYVA